MLRYDVVVRLEGTTVVLTATVVPSSKVGKVRLRNSNERLKQYVWAISWWMERSRRAGFSLLVAENSGNIDQLSHSIGEIPQSVRFIDVQPPPEHEMFRGKGFQEALLLDAASKELNDCTHIFKCTGRLRLLNWRKLMTSSIGQAAVTADWSPQLTAIDTRSFACGPNALADMAAWAAQRVDESRNFHLEHTLAEWLLQARMKGLPIDQFERSPLYVGESASTATKYKWTRAHVRGVIEQATRSRLVRR